MKIRNSLREILGIDIPIIQAGMVWCSGWKLASAVSNSGGLGVIGAGSMSPQVLEQHLIQLKNNTLKPYGVNLPLLYSHIEEQIEILIKYNVPIVITSAGSPNKYSRILKEHGMKVGHVVSSVKFALKVEEAGLDFVIAEGYEAGGHNGKEETTTFCLVPAITDAVSIPVVAAGGIVCGKTMFASMALGAKAVQIGSRFAVSKESSAHDLYKQRVFDSREGETCIIMRNHKPIRLLKNEYYYNVKQRETFCQSFEEISEYIGKGRSKIGIFNGDVLNGELEIGQCAMRINKMMSASDIIQEIFEEYQEMKKNALNSFP